MENQRIIQVEDKVPFKLLVPLSIQHMFAMFGASILVPFLCIPGSGRSGHQKLWGIRICLCTGRFCGRGLLRVHPGIYRLQVRHGMD